MQGCTQLPPNPRALILRMAPPRGFDPSQTNMRDWPFPPQSPSVHQGKPSLGLAFQTGEYIISNLHFHQKKLHSHHNAQFHVFLTKFSIDIQDEHYIIIHQAICPCTCTMLHERLTTCSVDMQDEYYLKSTKPFLIAHANSHDQSLFKDIKY